MSYEKTQNAIPWSTGCFIRIPMSWAVWYQKVSTITYTNQPIFFCSCTFHGTELESGRKPWQRNFQWTQRHHKTLNAQIRNSKFAFSKPPKMATKRPSWTSTFVAFQILAVMLLSKMYSTCAKLEWSGGDRGVTFWGSWPFLWSQLFGVLYFVEVSKLAPEHLPVLQPSFFRGNRKCGSSLKVISQKKRVPLGDFMSECCTHTG